jgi:hypothetical protein
VLVFILFFVYWLYDELLYHDGSLVALLLDWLWSPYYFVTLLVTSVYVSELSDHTVWNLAYYNVTAPLVPPAEGI